MNKKINKETSQKKILRKPKEYITRYYLMNVLAILQALVMRHLLFVLKVITAVPNTNVNMCLENLLN